MAKKFVVGILCKEGKYLAEKRQDYEDYFPGKVIFPGGSIEEDETAEEALIREMKEELRIVVKRHIFIGEYHYEDGATSKVYAIDQWEGTPEPIEAKSLHWIEREDQLSNETDKEMFKNVKEKGF